MTVAASFGEWRCENCGTWTSDPFRSSTATTCARCHHAFTAKPDGFVDADLENEIAAHRATCFVVGDAVRWQVGSRWHEGTIVALGLDSVEMNCERGYLTGYPFPMGYYRKNVRRIPRPGRDVAAPYEIKEQDGDLVVMTPSGPIKLTTGPFVTKSKLSAEGQATYDRLKAEYGRPPDPLSTTYDNVTLRDLLAADETFRREQTLISDMPLWFRIQDGLTPTQRTAVSAHHSAELKTKISAKREAERCEVCVDLQCEEDFEW
jgi:hypothetical protein